MTKKKLTLKEILELAGAVEHWESEDKEVGSCLRYTDSGRFKDVTIEIEDTSNPAPHEGREDRYKLSILINDTVIESYSFVHREEEGCTTEKGDSDVMKIYPIIRRRVRKGNNLDYIRGLLKEIRRNKLSKQNL
jgi:hypothetical protein